MSSQEHRVTIRVHRNVRGYDVDRLEALFRELHDHQLEAAPALAGLDPRDPASAWQRRQRRYLSWLKSKGALVLEAWDRDDLIGFAIVSTSVGYDGWQSGDTIGELHELVVTAGRRGEGVGSELIAAMTTELADQGIRESRVSLIAANDPARRFYASHGFEMVSHVMVHVLNE